MKFELCTDSAEGAMIASEFGFKSIELCSALSVGGLTPNYGLIKNKETVLICYLLKLMRHLNK